MGYSYGGYATLVGLTFTPEVFACGIDIIGPSNLETLLASTPPYWENFFEMQCHRIGDPRTQDGQPAATRNRRSTRRRTFCDLCARRRHARAELSKQPNFAGDRTYRISRCGRRGAVMDSGKAGNASSYLATSTAPLRGTASCFAGWRS